MLFGLLLPTAARAEGGLLTQISQLLSQNITPTDESMAMLKEVLGTFVLNPFSQDAAGDGNIMGDMFQTFNMFIFIVAMIWFTYTALAGLAQTMHEGVILGKRMSTVWVPIRIAFGAASLMPVFGGWAFCQALMVVSATLGIAGANGVSNKAIDSNAGFKTMVNPMGSVKQAGMLHDVESHVLMSLACMRAANALNQEAIDIRGVSANSNYQPSVTSPNNNTVVVQFPSDDGPTGCGKITLTFSPRSNGDGSLVSASTFGFRIQGINYDGIRQVSMQAHQQTLQAVITSANKVLDGALSDDPSAAAISSAVDELHNGYFGLYAKTFQGQLQQVTSSASSASNMSAVSDQLVNNMKQGGWATLGVWYAVFAETNEAMNEMLDPVVSFEEPRNIPDDTNELTAGGTSTMGRVLSSVKSMIDKAKSTVTTAVTTPTGNVSIGQWLMGGVINMLSSSTGSSNMINPIIAFKNIGDNAIVLAETLYAADKIIKGIKDSAIGKVASSALGTIGGAASKLLPSGWLIDVVTSVVTDLGELLTPIAFILFATAAAMAFYLPMLPFIQWFAALIKWFSSILESLVGSSLWALAHFDSDGDGMGQRTSYGYLYLFNNFARPIIMVFAFFFASATVTVLGTFLLKYYASAVASAQGNSVFGLVSIIASLVILTILGISLINGAFSLLLNMADRIIGWIGQNADSHIGADVESRVNAVFINAARSGAAHLPKIMGNPQPSSPSPSGGGGGLVSSFANKG
jgi:conjugal transfer/type IV secretion protein DotA/TraY